MIQKNSYLLFNLWLPLICLISLFIYLYMDAFSMLINTWSNMPRYSHGFIIPFVSLYLVWVKRNILLDTPVRPNSVIGIPLIITAVLFLIFGKISAVGIAQQVSILVMITGLIFQLLGTQSMRILLLPVSYLILMIPIFDGLISRFEWPFQLLSAEMAVKACKVMEFLSTINQI